MISHWQKVLLDHWNIAASLARLNGEYDLNFMALNTSGEGYVLKAMRPGCDTGLVEMQCAALEHIHANGTDVPTPDVKLTMEGMPFLEVCDENGEERLGVIKGAVPAGSPNFDYEIDGLSGATLTGNGVSNMLKYWLGQNGFGPFLSQLSESGV